MPSLLAYGRIDQVATCARAASIRSLEYNHERIEAATEPRTIADLDTPSVIVDLDILEQNIAEMADLARAAGVALRPHIKTHKTPEIARRQLAAGAVGVTCAKIGEAEALADAGLTDFFLAFPIVTAQKARRLAALVASPRCECRHDRR